MTKNESIPIDKRPGGWQHFLLELERVEDLKALGADGREAVQRARKLLTKAFETAVADPTANSNSIAKALELDIKRAGANPEFITNELKLLLSDLMRQQLYRQANNGQRRSLDRAAFKVLKLLTRELGTESDYFATRTLVNWYKELHPSDTPYDEWFTHDFREKRKRLEETKATVDIKYREIVDYLIDYLNEEEASLLYGGGKWMWQDLERTLDHAQDKHLPGYRVKAIQAELERRKKHRPDLSPNAVDILQRATGRKLKRRPRLDPIPDPHDLDRLRVLLKRPPRKKN